MKWSFIRWGYSALFAAALYGAGRYQNRFVSTTGVDVDLTYWATITTFLALLIAIAEIAHSIHATKSLRETVSAALQKDGVLTRHGAKGDSVNLLQKVQDELFVDAYASAHAEFKRFRALRRMVLVGEDLTKEQEDWDRITNILDVGRMAAKASTRIDGTQLSACIVYLNGLISKIEREARPTLQD